MNEARKKIDSILKENVIPAFRKLGFKGSLPHLRRLQETEVHLITFQFDRYGGGFVIELAKTKNEPFKTYWGKIIEVNDLTAHDLNNRIRIHPKGLLKNSAVDDWFRYDRSSLFSNVYKKVAKQVLYQVDLIEEIFRNDFSKYK